MSEVMRSLANPEFLAELVAREWGVPASSVTLHRTLTNDVYLVEPGHVLKVYRHGWRSVEEVAWECDFIAHLIDQGIPVPAVVPRLDGTMTGFWAAPEGPRAMVLLERVEGRLPVPPFAPGLHRAHGRLIAAIHRAGETFTSTHRRGPRDLVTTLDGPLAQILPVLADDDRERAAELAAEARRGLAGSAPTRGICHGDATMDNVLIVGGTTDEPELVVFDFDLAGEGYLATDFPFFAKNWEHFQAGYTEVREMTPDDLAAKPWLDAIDTIESIRFHMVIKPQWRGAESMSEGWLDEALATLREDV